MRIGVFVFWAAAASAAAQNVDRLDATRSVILPVIEVPHLIVQCGRPAPGPVSGIWQPDTAEIVKLEAALEAALTDAMREWSTHAVLRHYRLADCYRQYGGLIVSGRRIVYVNAFRQPPPDWRNTAPQLSCGGDGVNRFGAEYDVDSGRIQKLYFNADGGIILPLGLTVDGSALPGATREPPLTDQPRRLPLASSVREPAAAG
jgi:hypothetical protein